MRVKWLSLAVIMILSGVWMFSFSTSRLVIAAPVQQPTASSELKKLERRVSDLESDVKSLTKTVKLLEKRGK